MRRLQATFAGIGIGAFLALTSVSSRLAAYSTYNPSTTANGCFQCHPGFANRDALHDMHVGNTQMTNNCVLCHVTIGDNPSTSQSGAGVSCIGCHLAEGLRLHHQLAEAPLDEAGRTCTGCHTEDSTPVAESVEPPYYARADVSVKNPCAVATSNGGEDWDNDGTGLDNDGDLVYETEDTDCATPVWERTWGAIKKLYVQ
jgi:hypothetical protein